MYISSKKLQTLFAWKEFYIQNQLFEKAQICQDQINEYDSSR